MTEEDEGLPPVLEGLENRLSALEGAPSGGLGSATEFSATEAPNPIGGGPETMTVLEFGAPQPVLAVSVAGEDYPSLLVASDGDVFLGDGTVDPYVAGGLIRFAPAAARFSLVGRGDDPAALVVDGDVEAGGYTADGANGVVLYSPDGTRHRLKVANDGTLSSEVVT